VIELVRLRYADFGPSLAAEVLLAKDGVKVSRETLRKWMVEDGLWLSRKQRRSFHQPRLRRESYGELIQIDGSDHRWFEERGAACSLLVFIDDATGKLMQLRFVPSETTSSYFDCLRAGMTQFGRALAELNIEIICANSSQAKGRVERLNRTLQDRAGEGVATRRRLRPAGWQRLPAEVPGTVQREVLCSCGEARGPASPK
jgi:hypothetical protein